MTAPISLPCSAICVAAGVISSGMGCPAMTAALIWGRIGSVGIATEALRW
jgi:hypothetical protein